MPQPRPLSEILETAARIYRERLADFYSLAAITLLASWTVNQIIKIWTLGGIPLGALEDPRAPEFLRGVVQVFAAGVANGMVYALFNSVAGAVLTVLVAQGLRGHRLSLPEGIRGAMPRFGSVLGATLLYFLAMAGMIGLGGAVVSITAAGGLMTGLAGGAVGIVLGVVAGLAALGVLLGFGLAILYLSLRWALYPQIAVLEGLGAIESLRRSVLISRDAPRRRLGERYVFRAAVLLFALVLLQIVLGTIGAVPQYGVGLMFGDRSDDSGVSILNPSGMPLFLLIPLEILSVLLSAVAFPYGATVFVLFYLDVSARSPERFFARE